MADQMSVSGMRGPATSLGMGSRKRLTKEEENSLRKEAEAFYAQGYSVKLICRLLRIREEQAKRLLWEYVSQQTSCTPRTKFLFTNKDTLSKVFGSTGDYRAEISKDNVIIFTPLTVLQNQ